jgi:L-lactate dehydrogenase (cytochrome)
MTTVQALKACYNISDLRELAHRRLPSAIFNFLEGGAETEATARRNTAAFDEVRLLPRCLVDVSAVQTRTHILGQDVAWPLCCSPTGASRLFHPDGELAVARGAASTGTLYSLSTASTYSLEDVARASKGPKIFQLYIYKDRDVTRELIERAKRSGYDALCLTVDVPAVGKRERDLRSGFGIPPKWTRASLVSFACHPAWIAGRLRTGPVSMANFAGRAASVSSVTQLDPSVTWNDVREIVELWRGPFAIKGVMSTNDACRAADAGATAIIVSNHGGRQLDGAAASIEALPEIVRAVGDRIEVIIDGGIRRGVHILKALACGAKACFIGRPYLYGLSVGGELGVVKALEILKAEFVLAMTLAGCRDVEAIDGSLISASTLWMSLAREHS